MDMITVILVLIAVVAIMGGVIYCLIRDRKKQKDEIKELKNIINSEKKNLEQLSEYISKLDNIRKDEKELAEKIKEAKTDEELHKIISDIVALNNDRVQNDKDWKRNCPSTKATKTGVESPEQSFRYGPDTKLLWTFSTTVGKLGFYGWNNFDRFKKLK